MSIDQFYSAEACEPGPFREQAKSWAQIEIHLILQDYYQGIFAQMGAQPAWTIGGRNFTRNVWRQFGGNESHWQLGSIRIRSLQPRGIWIEDDGEALYCDHQSGQAYWMSRWSVIAEETPERFGKLATFESLNLVLGEAATEYEVQRGQYFESLKSRQESLTRMPASFEAKKEWYWRFFYPNLGRTHWVASLWTPPREEPQSVVG